MKNKKKKILFIFHQNNFIGGASRSLITILKYLKKDEEYDIEVLLPKKGEISKTLDEKKIKYYTSYYLNIAVEKNLKGYLKKIIVKIFNNIFYKKIYFKLKDNNYDLIYTNTSVIDIGYYLSKKIKVRHIVHIREFGEEDHRLEYLCSKDDIKHRYNDDNNIFITISKALEEKYKELLPEERLNLIYNGVEDNFLEKKYINKKKIKFILIGTLSEGKNQIEILKATKILIEKKISNFIIEIIGSGSPKYTEFLKNYVNKNNLENNVIFLGEKNKEEIKFSIYNSDVGLMTSHKEAFGRVTIEYMLGGLPVIASNTGANPELIKENFNGYLYKLGDPKNLSEKMEYFIEKYFEIERMGKIAREMAKNQYTDKIYYINIKKLLKNI